MKRPEKFGRFFVQTINFVELKKTKMNFSEYTSLFTSILNNPSPKAPYDNPDYFNYVKLNESRQKRWMKHGELLDETVKVINSINEKQHWILITEPWCGDAAHIVPFIIMMASLNSNIEVTIELRDEEPFRINDYLTNGGKAIPKLIVQNSEGTNLFSWGPRPEPLQAIFHNLKKEGADFEQQKIVLQNWYNENKGIEIQHEICTLIKN